MFEIVGGNPYLTQWELNRTVSNPCMKVNDEVVFVNSSGRTCVTYARMQSNVVVADVPNILLQDKRNILGTLGQSLEKHSECETAFEVHEADKPEGYVYEDNIKLPDNEQGGSSGGSGGGEEMAAQIIEGTVIDLKNSMVTKVRSELFEVNDSIVTVDFPNAVTVGQNAFYMCKKLTTVNIPNVINIDYMAFCGCEKLTTVSMPIVTSIGNMGFSDCNSIVEVNMPNVTSIGAMTFQRCKSLTKVDIGGLATVDDWAFSNCENLTTLILRTTDGVVVVSETAIDGSPIEGIYVPTSMYEAYRSVYEPVLGEEAFAYAVRKIEDYPEICG